MQYFPPGGGVSFTDSAGLASLLSDESGTGAIAMTTDASHTRPSLDAEVLSVAATVTAGTNVQGQGALTKDINCVTTASNNPSGVTLPTATTGRTIAIINKGANAINVYPATGAAIDALSANASIQIPVNGVLFFRAISATQWYSPQYLQLTTTGTSGAATLSNGVLNVPQYSGSMAYIMVSDQKTQNTQGGTFTSGAWRTRDINTEDADTGNNCSVSSNQITLAAGTYRCRIFCPAFNVNQHQARLQNVSDSSTVLTGQSCYQRQTSGDSGVSIISGRFTLSAQKTLEIQHQCTTTNATNGFGVACNFTTEVYTIAEFWKE